MGQNSCKLEPVSRKTPNSEVVRRGTRLARLRPKAPEVSCETTSQLYLQNIVLLPYYDRRERWGGAGKKELCAGGS